MSVGQRLSPRERGHSPRVGVLLVLEKYRQIALKHVPQHRGSQNTSKLRHDVRQRPNGSERKRWFAFDGPDRLKLTIDPAERSATLQDSSLIWERVRSR